MKSTVTFKILSIFLCSLIFAEFTPIKVISGDPEKIKKIYDTWVFSRDVTSVNPNWKLVNILT